MGKLWYGADEVDEFHPIVQKCLQKALTASGLDKKYVIKHHDGEFTSGIPDFVLLDVRTGDFVCVIEVKKTPSDVFYYGYQPKEYVDQLYPLRWKPNYYPYFCITNIEITQFFCWRKDSSVIGCMLAGSPHDSGSLNDGQKCLDNFTGLFTQFFIQIDKLNKPEFSMYLEAISESFNETFYTISKILGVNLIRMSRLIKADDQVKQSVLYELLRFAFYYYIKESYELIKSPYKKYFGDFDVNNISNLELLNIIEQNFAKAMEIDFKDILKDYESSNAIIPHRLKKDTELSATFNNFIQTLRNNAAQGIKKNGNLLQFVSLLTSEIYNKEEMHASGKIMSDETLSNILAEFAIESKEDLVIDPGCGDGNLLMSAYKRIKELNPKATHNEILAQLVGIEIDANLIQLAAFKLICSNLANVNKDTLTNLGNTDLFETTYHEKFDALVMNPPFLRNEDLTSDMKSRYLGNIEQITNTKSYIRSASQPNLYFFFVEKAVTLLKNNAKASIILMTKFLNNEDGEFLKEYLKPHLTAVIAYPPNFFEGFAVTTCIVLLQKESRVDKVAFIKIKDTALLSELEKVKKIIASGRDQITETYALINIPKDKLSSKENWRLYLADPTNIFKKFEGLKLFKPLNSYFDTIQRGKADNCGGSGEIYPFSPNNQLLSDANLIEDKFTGFGMQRNKVNGARRSIILTDADLNLQKGILFPNKFDSSSSSGISQTITNCQGLKDYCLKFKNLTIKGKAVNLEKIMNSAYGSAVSPLIIIPRADREKHIVYYNQHKTKPILMSTNFFYFDNFKNYNKKISVEKTN